VSRFAFAHPVMVSMGLEVAGARIRRALRGPRCYPGSAVEVLRAGLEDCWTGRLLTASPATYRQFWTRDTGFAAASLVGLGSPWPERLLASLAWAMGTWRRRRSHVTTTIDPRLRWPADIFDYGVDSLPMLLWSLQSLTRAADPRVAEGAAALAHGHRDWVAAEVDHFVDLVVDPSTGLVRSDRHFSAHRDTFRNASTAYANTMVALLARTVAETGWGPDRLGRYFEVAGGAADWGVLLRTHFWMGDRFRDRLGSAETSGEANVWPFFLGLIGDREMLGAALATLERDGYATPYPLRFSVREDTDRVLPAFRLWSPDYQTTPVWTSLGSVYLSLLREVDPVKAAAELDRARRLIERDGTFWEVLDLHGRPWRSRRGVSITDQSMLWGAVLLEAMLESPP